MAVAAGTSPRKTPQSCVGRFVVIGVEPGFVPPDEDLEQVFGGVGAELLHAEVFEDEEVDARELLHEVAPGPGGVGLGEVRGEIEGAADERAVAGADGADGDRGGDVGLADAGRADEEQVGVRPDEARRREFGELRLRDLGIEGPVEVGQGLLCDDAGLFQPAREEPVGASGELVLDEQLEKLQMRERRGLGLRDAAGQRFDHAGQTQMTQAGGEWDS